MPSGGWKMLPTTFYGNQKQPLIGYGQFDAKVGRYRVLWFMFHDEKNTHHTKVTQKIKLHLGLSPLPVTAVTVTTRIVNIVMFLVGDPYKPSFATVTGRGDNPSYTPETNSKFAPKNWCLEDKPFLLERPISERILSFRGSPINYSSTLEVVATMKEKVKLLFWWWWTLTIKNGGS